MYRTSFVFLLLLISISSIITDTKFNSSIASTLTTTLSILTSQEMSLSCTYCQTKACRCSSTKAMLNCSSYLLNLTFASNCAEMIIWKTVDFSSRNLEVLDSTRLLSLRMNRLLLKSNLISIINDNIFDSIGDILIELDLQINLLSTVSSKWLNSKMTQLKILNLASNQLESFSDLDDVQLPNLQQLNLSCNQLNIFPYKIHQWTSLIKLDLSFNKLSSIPRFALMDLNDLTWLSLASNRNLSCKYDIKIIKSG
jgi:Leucine-rich repeat (LRR) protein